MKPCLNWWGRILEQTDTSLLLEVPSWGMATCFETTSSMRRIQLDYSVVRAADNGAGQIARIRLRAHAPSRSSEIRIDESGTRETRVFLPDGSQRAFRFITPMRVAVKGITIDGFPSSIVLERGRPDTTVLRLNDFLFDPVHSFSDIDWELPSNTSLLLDHDPNNNHLRISAPEEASAWERVVVTATNPDGQSASDTVDVFVNAPPSIGLFEEAISLSEDGNREIAIEIDDPDTPMDLVSLRSISSARVDVAVLGPPFSVVLSPAPDWYGKEEITLIATDNFAFADTATVTVNVLPVNDPPELLVSPNILLTQGKQDSTLDLSSLIFDADESPEDLHLSWSGTENIQIQLLNGRIVLSSREMDWLGTEEIALQVEDADGLTDSAVLTVTVVPSVPPNLVDAPTRYGLASGSYFVLSLSDLVVDPDDAGEKLGWEVSGNERLLVQFNNTGQARIEAPESFVGSEVLRFTVVDPSGASASFDLLVFSASQDGQPVLADLPEIFVPADGVDSSIDLDDYVFDADHGVHQLSWTVSEDQNLTVTVDPETHVLSVAPDGTRTDASIQLDFEV